MGADAFWRDPPWRGGRPPFRLGLTPIPDAAWLPDAICDQEYRRKRILLSEAREKVLSELKIHSYSIDNIGLIIREQLLARGYSDRAMNEASPLARAALMVPDDLCVLVPSAEGGLPGTVATSGAGGWMLAGACLCSPSYWRLADKIGRPLAAIHAPVPGLERALGPRIARFLDNLPIGQAFLRRNWNIHRGAERFHPGPERWDPPPDPAGCEALFVRSERQTLRKFDRNVLLFTIGVSVHPLAEIRAYPDAVADLLRAMAGMTPDERSASGFRHHGEALLTWLQGLGGER